ncbi:NAD-dependent epimerase/dehydratase family protein [Marinoscillum furvescens]|uniref:Nucleoside-diphosphate-sugar epimerase n=1 Tax=Marinoscillum furvescens DSM 4134 TaxID=1122208 RepID=A0A3D9L1S1_MARFU|nr:NAD(P)-dependent oxidoreductase [Marinoscillum furvescens]RED98006.1 nucleoside-diphosphate-sugar epimerase [Marinoscillum furvescens DSM 4134]
MRILITGANGFLGSHLVETAIAKDHEVTALLRKGAGTSNLSHLSKYKTVLVDYTSVDTILQVLKDLGQYDLIIHNAGLTKSYTFEKYKKVNVDLTERILQAIIQANSLSPGANFAFISSLAAKGPTGNGGPASNYGRSKVMAEDIVRTSGVPYMIYRPTGIYGARDVQFVPLIKAVRMGIYPFMTPADHKMTLINARDVAENVIECAVNHTNEIVHLEDGQVYEHDDLKQHIDEALNTKSKKIKVPIPIVKTALRISDWIDNSLNRTPTLSLEHYSEISQNWDYDFSSERKRIPLTINYPLKKGFIDAIDYYRQNKLI